MNYDELIEGSNGNPNYQNHIGIVILRRVRYHLACQLVEGDDSEELMRSLVIVDYKVFELTSYIVGKAMGN